LGAAHGKPNYWGDLLYGGRSGAVAFDRVHGSGVWEYRIKHPAEAAIFDRAMATIGIIPTFHL
jgi:hypothetical protein